MKKLMTVLLCVIFAISVIYHPVTALAVNGEHDCDPNADIVSSDVIDETVPPEEEIPCVPISEIDLDDDLAFLADYEVSIPSVYLDAEDLNGSIRAAVDYARNNNYRWRTINVVQAYLFYKQIAIATAKHDGVDIGALRSDSGEPTRYTLVDSTKYGSWKVYYENTNCYGYALGKKGVRRNIGYFSGKLSHLQFLNYMTNGNVKGLALAFEEDLKSLGYSVTSSISAPSATTLSNANNVVICLRIHKGDPTDDKDPGDFHFMRYNQTAKGWVHKPGITQVLKYNKQAVNSSKWSNEGMLWDGIPYPPDMYYDSVIYYFVCTPHRHISEEVTGTGNTSAHTCLCILCGKVFYQAHTPNASGSACTVCGRKPPFTSLRFVGGEGFEAALPQMNHDAFLRKFNHDNNQ